jgi:hypothetical protein
VVNWKQIRGLETQDELIWFIESQNLQIDAAKWKRIYEAHGDGKPVRANSWDKMPLEQRRTANILNELTIMTEIQI